MAATAAGEAELGTTSPGGDAVAWHEVTADDAWGICLLGLIVHAAFTELGKLLDRRAAQRRPALAPTES